MGNPSNILSVSGFTVDTIQPVAPICVATETA